MRAPRARPLTLSILVVTLALAVATPAHAGQAARTNSEDGLRARAALCIPCGVYAAVLVVRVAQAVRTIGTAAKVAAVGRIVRARAGRGVSVTRARVAIVRHEAARVASRGSGWVRGNWSSLKPYVRACLEGAAALEASDIMKNGYMSLLEWRNFLTLHFGMTAGAFLNDGYRQIYDAREFDLRKTADAWGLSCIGGMTLRGALGPPR